MNGFSNGTFRPNATVSRAEAAVMLLKLTKQPVPTVALSPAVKDVPANHWARRQIAAAIDAGLLTLGSNNNFYPNAALTRLELARGLAIMTTLAPERKVPLVGTLVPVKGTVTVTQPDKQPEVVSSEVTCGAGTNIKTGAGEAKLNFPDGSGLLLKPGTELTIKEAWGVVNFKRDGSSVVVLDQLDLKLPSGKFESLASTYFYQKKILPKVSSSLNLVTPTRVTRRGLPAAASQIPWWKEASTKKVRVRVDMPWGVTGVRGTFWYNEAETGGEITNVLDGETRVFAGGKTVDILAGMTTSVTGAESPPTRPTTMSSSEQQAWVLEKDWLKERIAAIQSNASIIGAVNSAQDIEAWIMYQFNSNTSSAINLGGDGGGG